MDACVIAAEPAPVQPSSATADAIVVYDRVYFAQFSALTAEDLLRRIPGIQDLIVTSPPGGAPGGGNQGQRGFGSSGSAILFNGRRLSGKSNDPITALQRIQARQVVRVEVIRGQVPGLDVRVGDQGVLVNVVLEGALTTGIGSWEGNIAFWEGGKVMPGGRLTYSGTWDSLTYNLAISSGTTINRRHTADLYLRPGSAPFASLDLLDQGTTVVNVATASLTYTFINGDIANLNGRWSHDMRTNVQPADEYSLTPAGPVLTVHRLQRRVDPRSDNELEIGGDYEHVFENGDTLRTLFLANSDARPSDARFFTTLPGGQERYDRQQKVHSIRTEKILRGTYAWQIAPGYSLEMGGEIALNGINQKAERFDNVGGVFRDINLFNSDSRVRETRLESTTSYSWQISPDLYLEGAVDTEFSRLKQSGRDVNSSRKFFFAKPRVDLRFDIDRFTQLRARVLRTVSQLDFANFVSNFVNDDVRLNVILAGNPDLVPEKTWTIESTYERRFSGSRNVVSARIFYNFIDDHIDRILIVPGVAGVGNIGWAETYGVEARAGVGLGWFGLSNASLDATGTLQHSSVIDSFTLDRRKVQAFPDYKWSLAYRHDTGWRGMSYGATVTASGPYLNSDIDFRHTIDSEPDATAYLEFRPLTNVTARVEGTRLLQTRGHRDRFQYVGPRSNGVLLRQELRRDVFDRSVRFIVRSSF